MVDFDFSKHCCGCGACADVCPKRCIIIIEDSKDFRIPKVKSAECINCGLCENVCPVLNSGASKGIEKLLCCYNKDKEQRRAGSSGSIFVLFAERILALDGVVIGAAFDSDLQLRHTIAKTIEEVRPLMKSKYIQSDTTGIFNKVKKSLKDGQQVLFVGTPCQCQALYNFLGQKRHDNLLLVDFICHGVPSQKLFDKAIASYEQRNGCKVQSFSFREKSKGLLHCYSIYYKYNGDDEVEKDIGLPKDFPFYYGYLKYNIFREGCYECLFARRERVSDITLGDFWHLTKIKKDVTDFRKGYSMVVVNTEKGMSYIQQIASDIVMEEYPIEIAEINNYAYVHPTRKRLLHRLFMKDYNVKPFSEVERIYLSAPNGLRLKLLNYLIDKINL